MVFVTSDFADFDIILGRLVYNEIVKIFTDEGNQEWAVLIADIQPLTIFPEYLISRIAKKVRAPSELKKLHIPLEEFNISTEVAQLGLSLLEQTASEKIEFKEVLT